VQAGRRVDKFALEAWGQFWASGALQPMPEFGTAAAGALACDEDACRWRAPGGALVVVARTPLGAQACDAAVVLAPMPARLRCGGAAVPVIDRFSVWREGAYAVWLEPGGVRLLSEQTLRGDRPWAPPPGHARSLAGLTMAPTEALPPE
jgi:competence protein ComEC